MEEKYSGLKRLFSWKVPSRSKPGTFHRVDVYDSGDMDCDCIAGQMNKFCHHKNVILATLKELVKKIIEINKLYGKETSLYR